MPDSVRITVQLIDGESNFHLWSDQYDRAVASVIAIQEEIARRVVRELSVALTRPTATLVSARTGDPVAYDRYLLGRAEWNARGEGLSTSIDHFRAALRLDPDFALAYSGLADAYVLLFEHNDMSSEEALPLARISAERALELDSTLAEAQTSLAEVLAAERLWDAAEDRFRRALRLRGAKALDPLSAIVRTDLGAAYYHAGRFEEAVAEAEACRGARICADDGRVYVRALLELGRTEEALTAAREGTLDQVLALAAAGREAQARRVMLELRERAAETGDLPDRPITHLYRAEMYVALGEYQAALDAVERAEELGLATGPVLIREWPLFGPIRDHPRYRRVVERMGYPPAD
ncbi:MAG: hypothetical protein PVI57_03680 [Gemmatimonadota bacterium]